MRNAVLVILFGSRARGSPGAASDFDIAVLGSRELTLKEKGVVQRTYALHFSVPEERIDVVDLWSASPLLAHQVGQTGKLIEGSEATWIRFRILAWKRYLDTAKFRRMRSLALRQKIYAR